MVSYFCSNDQTDYYHVRRRYFTSFCYIFLAGYLVVISMLSNVVPLIICILALCGTLLPYVIYLAAFLKFRVTSQALIIWRFNPFKPIVLPWSSIQNVMPGLGQSYTIIGSDGKQKAYFTITMERFDGFVEELRRRRITIEEKSQAMPQLASLNEEHKTDNESLLSPERKLRTIRKYSLFLFLSLVTLLLGVIQLCVGVLIVRTSIFAIILLFPMGLFFCGIGILLLEPSLNRFIRISSDGIDLNKYYGRRHFVPWSEFSYARIMDTAVMGEYATYTIQIVRLYQKGHPDYVGAVPSTSEAYLPVLQEVISHHIPLLRETEQLSSVH